MEKKMKRLEAVWTSLAGLPGAARVCKWAQGGRPDRSGTADHVDSFLQPEEGRTAAEAEGAEAGRLGEGGGGWGTGATGLRLAVAALGALAVQMWEGVFIRAPYTSTPGPERTQTGTTKLSSGEGGEREIGEREGKGEGRGEGRRLQLRCQRWRTRSGKGERAAPSGPQDRAGRGGKCSKRDFTEPGKAWLTTGVGGAQEGGWKASREGG